MNVLFARRCTLHARVLAGCRRTMPAHAGFMVMIPMRLPVFSAREPKASGSRCPSRQGMALVRPDSWRQGRQKMPEKPAPLLKHEPCQKERGSRGEPALPKKDARPAAAASLPRARRRPARATGKSPCRARPCPCACSAPPAPWFLRRADSQPRRGQGRHARGKLFHRLLTGIRGWLLIR